MSLFRIAWRSIEQRGVASILTTLSMALGVMMVVAVLSILGVVTESFRSNASLGYNMIAGAKGGKLQLTLNTVYYLSQPVENLPYDFYLEFLPASVRARHLENSVFVQAHQRQQALLPTHALAGFRASPGGLAGLGGLASAGVAHGLHAVALEKDRDGKFSQFTMLAIPVCLGDYFGRFRVVGTTTEFFDQLTYGPASDRHYEFAEGRNFVADGHFEAVMGAKAAREMNVSIGDTFATTHGDPEGEGHGTPFTVVGILKPTGTPNDRAAFVNMEGFYLMEGHAKPVDDEEEASDASGGDNKVTPLAVEQREVTAVLVRTIMPAVTMGLQNSINEGAEAQAVLPVREIFNLFELIVKPLQYVLLTLTVLICVVSGVSILVSIYNSMSDRRHEIAVMRALGASRGTVMAVILTESVLLSVGGGLLGWFGGHALNWLCSSRIESQTGVAMRFWDVAPPVENLELLGLGPIIGVLSPEFLIIPGLIVLAVIVGFLPAMAAYRTDVARSLQP